MKFVCEVNNMTYLLDEENLSSPKEAAGMAFRYCDREMDLEYERDYRVSVYDETGVTIFPVKKEEKYDYCCHIHKYSIEIECKANNAYAACAKALVEAARDIIFEGKEVLEIVAESEEAENGTYNFIVHGPANGPDA